MFGFLDDIIGVGGDIIDGLFGDIGLSDVVSAGKEVFGDAPKQSRGFSTRRLNAGRLSDNLGSPGVTDVPAPKTAGTNPTYEQFLAAWSSRMSTMSRYRGE